uniref:CHHC U11-48K-type domain-containing protein n=1 Tax=Pararge aegeria TaxID=116150 RepID=S4P014_9NEOP
MQCTPKSTCKYNSNHKVPPEKLKEHEEKCFLKSQGYAQDDLFLPDVFDPDSNTVFKLSSQNIVDIFNYASKTDPAFERVRNNQFHLALKIYILFHAVMTR